MSIIYLFSLLFSLVCLVNFTQLAVLQYFQSYHVLTIKFLLTNHYKFQPIPIANIEDMRCLEVRSEDEVTRTVLIHLQNEKIVPISLEERDACELTLVLRGYFKLATNQNLPVDQEEPPQIEDLAPPYLSQHKVVPEKWSFIDQSCLKTSCFAVMPIYKNINKKTNGLYNTVGRQSKQPLMIQYSLDNNMNRSIADRNRFFSVDNGKPNHVDSEAYENGILEARNDEVNFYIF